MSPDKESIRDKVEKLLRKAESSEYEAERNTYVAKAQELMTRHAIEEAELRIADGTEVTIERMRIDTEGMKYSKARFSLIDSIAVANNCYDVAWPYLDANGYRYGRRGYEYIEVFGTPSSLELVKMLWDSLNHQLDMALAETPVPDHVPGKTFRNNFVRAYAIRIGERLTEAKQETLRGATTSSTALVLVNQAEQARDFAFDLHDGKISSRVERYRGSDAGQTAGRQAGDRASLQRGALT